jgi:hypothetical protein
MPLNSITATGANATPSVILATPISVFPCVSFTFSELILLAKILGVREAHYIGQLTHFRSASDCFDFLSKPLTAGRVDFVPARVRPDHLTFFPISGCPGSAQYIHPVGR